MKTRIILLILIATLMLMGVVGFSLIVLPDPPIGPTATFPEGIDLPNERPVPQR